MQTYAENSNNSSTTPRTTTISDCLLLPLHRTEMHCFITLADGGISFFLLKKMEKKKKRFQRLTAQAMGCFGAGSLVPSMSSLASVLPLTGVVPNDRAFFGAFELLGLLVPARLSCFDDDSYLSIRVKGSIEEVCNLHLLRLACHRELGLLAAFRPRKRSYSLRRGRPTHPRGVMSS